MYKNIVVALDGSAHSNKALDSALELGSTFGAALHLVHVSELHPLVLGSASVMSMLPQDELEKRGTAVLEPAAARATGKGCAVETYNIIGESTAAQGVLDTAAEVEADLIVVGSLGHSNLSGLLVGSVSQRICHLATCPCLVVR